MARHAHRSEDEAAAETEARTDTRASDAGTTDTGGRPVADDRRTGVVHDRDHHTEEVRDGHAVARERFGGMNWGSCFFGWLVSIGITIVLLGIVGAIATAVGYGNDVTQSDAERQAGTIGIVAAAVLLLILFIAYYAGGYVAGRMSRFDGGRQGVGVWVIGLVLTIVAAVLGAVFGDQYDVLDRVDLPRIPIPTDQLGTGGLVTAVLVVLGTLLFAFLGGKAGQRYHRRVDSAVYHGE